jgi:hypothetical protein
MTIKVFAEIMNIPKLAEKVTTLTNVARLFQCYVR